MKKDFTIEVPRHSKEEHEAIVAHYECVGLGKLRFDKGKVLNDCHEMIFLHMVSGGVGRHLLKCLHYVDKLINLFTIWDYYYYFVC